MKHIAQGSLAELRALKQELSDRIENMQTLLELRPSSADHFQEQSNKYLSLHNLASNEIEKRIDTLISKHVEK